MGVKNVWKWEAFFPLLALSLCFSLMNTRRHCMFLFGRGGRRRAYINHTQTHTHVRRRHTVQKYQTSFNYVDIPSGNAPKDHIKSIKCERHRKKGTREKNIVKYIWIIFKHVHMMGYATLQKCSMGGWHFSSSRASSHMQIPSRNGANFSRGRKYAGNWV